MTGFDALDLLNIGFIVTDAAGCLLFANGTAERILQAHDGVELTADRKLSFWAGCNSPGIEESILTVKSGRKQIALALQRPSGKRPLTLIVRSARGAELSDYPEPATTVMFILDPESPAGSELGLQQLYELTSAETRLANLLMEGKTLEECCALLGIRRSTAKMHLRNVFAKTGVQRQGELVALLFNSTGSVRVDKGSLKSGRKHLLFGERPDPGRSTDRIEFLPD
jgi:DNA-binding CsgD family transcriptional regulator